MRSVFIRRQYGPKGFRASQALDVQYAWVPSAVYHRGIASLTYLDQSLCCYKPQWVIWVLCHADQDPNEAIAQGDPIVEELCHWIIGNSRRWTVNQGPPRGAIRLLLIPARGRSELDWRWEHDDRSQESYCLFALLYSPGVSRECSENRGQQSHKAKSEDSDVPNEQPLDARIEHLAPG